MASTPTQKSARRNVPTGKPVRISSEVYLLPYRDVRGIWGQCFELARRGCKISDLIEFVTKMGGSPAGMLRGLRRGRLYKGAMMHIKWKVEESNGRILVIPLTKKDDAAKSKEGVQA